MPSDTMARNQHHIHRPVRVSRKDIPAGACVCDHCVGKCCRYFSLPIKDPETWDDFDELRWFLAHGRTVVYLEKGTWYLLVMEKCRYLTDQNRCAIYEHRPQICDDYESDNCEYDSDWSFEKVFEAPEQVEEYAEAILPPSPRRKARARRDLVVVGPPPRVVEASPKPGRGRKR